MIALLEPLFPGEWAVYGAGLSCEPAPPGAIRLDRLLAEPALLEQLLRSHAEQLGCADPRPVAASWALAYFGMLLPPFAAAATILQHRFPLAPSDVALSVDAAGRPLRLHLPHTGWAMPASPLAARYDELLWLHLQPLIEALARQGRVAARLLWGNATRYLGATLEQIVALSGGAAHCRDDSERLLLRDAWPDGRANPLFGPLRQIDKCVDGAVVTLALHRECCLNHMLPGAAYCSACPLLADNLRLLKAAPKNKRLNDK
ncbi:siderophore-iron reductase FhuF [Janthinobacterium fluminis]|uniref:Siderophore-iron reductase FhuF n=1 Tax=Janthinobacterium fluminis TaxID=2987524 RepID=A0ABT5K3Z2_9BURK|nr:siderophore-iron reductase FhuF [Janthinobacterium fluminis]MDC8759693.1 siderophore-iron reductase FhuF [Janthinobacterium fluminis]